MGLLARLGLRPRASGNAKPAEWLFTAFAGESVSSGVRINEDSGLNISAVWACVRLISESVASLPLLLYERDGNTRQRLTDHPLYQVLHDSPSDATTSMAFRTTMTAHVLTWGNAYAEIVRGSNGRPRELRILPPHTVSVDTDGAGRQVYVITQGNRDPRRITRRNVLHIAGLGYDGITGYSPIRRARETLGLAVAGNGTQPGGILSHPAKLSDGARQNIVSSMRRERAGPENAHKLMVLEEGMSWTQTSIPPDDAQFLETRKFEVEEIARWYGVPLHMIQSLERATFSNIEHQSIDYVTHTLRPWLVRWEQEIKRKLISPLETDLYAEHLVDALLRGDTKTRYEAYQIGRQGGWLSANDIRRAENMTEIDGGDEYLVPLNMAPANQAEADLVREQVENEAEREAQAIGRAIHRYQALADEFSSWLARYLEQRKRHAETRLKMSAQQARQWVGLATNRLVNCKDLRDVSVLLNDWQAQRWQDFKEVLNDG
jgi:HK97 family phage portal protein